MQSQKIEDDVKQIIENYSAKDFIYDFLIAFGFTKMTIKRLREGNSNLAQKENQLIIKQKLFYEYSAEGDIFSIIDDLKNDSATYTHKPRFIVVNNDKELLSIDTKTQETLAVELNELHKNIDFFMPWTGKEKYIAHQENPADVKAAEKMANIYDEIVKLNPNLTEKDNSHSLNIFLTRLLFCFFAEDTGIFEDNIFTKTVVNHTNEDGSDLADVLGVLFESLDKKDNEKSVYPSFMQEFPYVNGKLFTDKVDIPKLNSKVRKLMIDCGNQDWKEINPDIFGSMFQAVSVAEVRSGLGQHYTSVPNIMKVIEPLFLNDLREEYEKADTEKKLNKLLDRISHIKIFDPACGSGNFLIIAYKQLRLLEMDIINKIRTLPGQHPFMMSRIQLNQFYGIEIDDFACEIATLSLWLAEHQMNRKFKDLFGDCKPPLPLDKSGNIVCGNATRLDWEQVCPKGIKGISVKDVQQMTIAELEKTKQLELQGIDNEIYILGNPPYVGSRNQNNKQKNDMDFAISKIPNYRKLDYISIWFYKASEYIKNNNSKYAFVSTNSICQGEQVSILWSKILSDLEILFAYTTFKWGNNAKHNAGVSVVIIGISNISNKQKYIYTNKDILLTNKISPSLTSATEYIIEKQTIQISNLPYMRRGNMPNDKEFLRLTKEERTKIITEYPGANEFIRRQVGADEFINDIERYCYWISDERKEVAMSIKPIKEAVENVKNYRLNSKDKTLHAQALFPHQFREFYECKESSLIIPIVSSENREYIPIGFMRPGTIVPNSAQVIYDADKLTFGIITSKMHMVWIRHTAGRLENRFRYSIFLCYNTFPFPKISDKQQKIIEMYVDNILLEREKHSDKTMAELYDPDKMPQGLREAHHSLDLAIEKCYRQAPFESDEKRLEHLFKRYEIMTDPTKKNNAEEQLSLI